MEFELENNEKWVIGYEGLYSITNEGKCFSFRSGVRKEMKLNFAGAGYHFVNLSPGDGKFYPNYIHRLVAQMFIENPENKPCVNHKDGVKLNNRVENLEWVTAKENNLHALENSLRLKKITEDERKSLIDNFLLNGDVKNSNLCFIWKNINRDDFIRNHIPPEFLEKSVAVRRVSIKDRWVFIINIFRLLSKNVSTRKISKMLTTHESVVSRIKNERIKKTEKEIFEKYKDNHFFVDYWEKDEKFIDIGNL